MLCALASDYRSKFAKPFLYNGYYVATDTKILVRIKKELYKPKNKIKKIELNFFPEFECSGLNIIDKKQLDFLPLDSFHKEIILTCSKQIKAKILYAKRLDLL